jgi:hypothetical protein
MPSTPLAGQISFSDVKSLTTDKIGYTPPVNASLGTLAGVVRQFGQKAPSTNNIAFSNFYLSTIAGYVIETIPENPRYYYNNNNDGCIEISFRNSTFKNDGSGTSYVKATVLAGSTTVRQVAEFIDWNSAEEETIGITGLNSGNYTVTITDLTTGGVIGTTSVTVNYGGSRLTYYNNA